MKKRNKSLTSFERGEGRKYMDRAAHNTDFRHVLSTDSSKQYVAMYLKPGETIGNEKHPHITQEFWVVKGRARIDIEDVGAPIHLGPGGSAMVVPGRMHDVGNESRTNGLHLLTIYYPPQHPAGTIHKTRQDAIRAEAKGHKHNPGSAPSVLTKDQTRVLSLAPCVFRGRDRTVAGKLIEMGLLYKLGPTYHRTRAGKVALVDLPRRENRVRAVTPMEAEAMLLEAQAMEVQESPTATGRPRAERRTFKEMEAQLGKRQKACQGRVRRLQTIDKALRKLKKTPGNEEKIAALKAERATVAVTRGTRKGKAPKCLYEPGGLAAAIGRGKYGKQWMTQKARASKAMRRPNPRHLTDQNLDAMLRELKRGGGTIPGRVQPSAAPHLKRCIEFGLLQLAGQSSAEGWVLSPEGELVVRDYLAKYPQRDPWRTNPGTPGTRRCRSRRGGLRSITVAKSL